MNEPMDSQEVSTVNLNQLRFWNIYSEPQSTKTETSKSIQNLDNI